MWATIWCHWAQDKALKVTRETISSTAFTELLCVTGWMLRSIAARYYLCQKGEYGCHGTRVV